MPKAKKLNSALKRARALLKPRQESETEDDTQSDHSEEYSHVPLKFEIPLLSSLFIEDTNDTENSVMENNNGAAQVSAFDTLVKEIQKLSETLATVKGTQTQQQLTLNTLMQNNASGSSSAPRVQNAYTENLFKIPDPIKAIPRFEGNRRQLTAWLTTAENTLNVFKNLVSESEFEIYTTAVINKVEGKARDIICLAGNPQKFEEIKEILINALGDRQELTFYKSQLWQTKMDSMSLFAYYNKCKETVQNIKTLAKQKQKYKDNWDAINAFIEEDALAAFLAGLREPYFGLAQAAGPEDIEAAYAFVCKFKSREQTASNMDKFKHNKANSNTKRDQKDTNDDKNMTPHKKTNPYQPRNKPDPPDHASDQPQPMELGSTRSNLTLNKRQVNNNEISEEENSDSEDENVDLNFCWVQDKLNLT